MWVATIRKSEIRPGLRTVLEFTISRDDMDKFASVSGDYNPLHRNPKFAQEKNFNDVVVYGALLVAKISNLIGMKMPGRDSLWSTLNIQFHRPLYVNIEASVIAEVLAISQSSGMVSMKLLIESQGHVIAKGKAEVLILDE